MIDLATMTDKEKKRMMQKYYALTRVVSPETRARELKRLARLNTYTRQALIFRRILLNA